MTQHIQRRRARAGFSLMELLVVIIIMIILLAIIVSAIRRMEISQNRGETIGRLHSVARALSIYRADWGDVPPYNPTGEVGVPDGAGLWTLVMLDYLNSARYLHDAGYPDPEAPWINVGGRTNGLDPSSNEGLLEIYNEATGSGQVSPLTPGQTYAAYLALAAPAAHATPDATGGTFTDYDDEANENWCSWMMQDPFTREWKYQPVRRSATSWPVDDPSQPQWYRRQLSNYGTDDPTKTFLPASDTVVTWSTAFRTTDLRPAPEYNKDRWGSDVVLFADGHVAVLPAPDSAGWAPPRAELRAPRQ